MNSYTNIIAGKNISDIQMINFSTTKRFDSMPALKLKKGESIRSRTATAFIKPSHE